MRGGKNEVSPAIDPAGTPRVPGSEVQGKMVTCVNLVDNKWVGCWIENAQPRVFLNSVIALLEWLDSVCQMNLNYANVHFRDKSKGKKQQAL